MKLSFFKKIHRSFIKRFLVKFVNQSDSFVLQHIPESAAHQIVPFAECRDLWITKNRRNNDIDLVRLMFLTQTIEELLDKNVPGAIAELGVYKGNSAKLLHILAPQRKLYRFDTFQGFDPKDIKVEPKGKVQLTKFRDTSLAEVQQYVNGSTNVTFCPGYFPETSHHIPENETFSLVHLDADL